jgi:hypothetical protein
MAFLGAAVVSVAFERTLFRRLYRATELNQVLFTIGLVFVSAAVAAYLFGTVQQPVELPGYLRGSVSFAGMTFGVYRLFLIAFALAITALLIAGLELTRFGAQVRAAVPRLPDKNNNRLTTKPSGRGRTTCRAAVRCGLADFALRPWPGRWPGTAFSHHGACLRAAVRLAQ